jgi:hypothetical protein
MTENIQIEKKTYIEPSIQRKQRLAEITQGTAQGVTAGGAPGPSPTSSPTITPPP